MIQVLLVDDHELVRSGIEAILNRAPDIRVTALAETGEQALALLEQQSFDVILMDINMPGMGGLEACRRILQQKAAPKLIVLTVHDRGVIPRQLLNLGVQGFISKNSSPEEMMHAIKKVVQGQRYLASEVATHLLDTTAAKTTAKTTPETPFASLSPREQEIVQLILQGKSIKEMSDLLLISPKTVNTYRYRLYEKLGVKNDVELTRLALQCNHLDPSWY